MEETNDNIEPLRPGLQQVYEVLDKLKAEMAKAVIGQQDMIHELMVALLAGGHVLLEGVPGIAKTLTARSLSQAIDAKFSRIQFTPDLLPSDILGTSIFNPKTLEFEYREGPIFANLVLIDEINRAPAKTQAALFEVMEEGQVTVDGKTRLLPDPFLVIATQNPIEHEGTYRLPEAQLDRFMLKVEVNYPEAADELEMLKLHHQNRELFESVGKVISTKELKSAQTTVAQVIVEEPLLQYISEVVRTTRAFAGIYLGASPRAAIALLYAAKANAVIEQRDFITPDDIKRMALPVLRHRILLTPEKEMEGEKSDKLIEQVLAKVEVPR